MDTCIAASNVCCVCVCVCIHMYMCICVWTVIIPSNFNSYHHLLSRMAELRGRLLQITGEVRSVICYILHSYTHPLCRILCQPPIRYMIHRLRALSYLVRSKEMTGMHGESSHNFLLATGIVVQGEALLELSIGK